MELGLWETKAELVGGEKDDTLEDGRAEKVEGTE